MAPNYVSLQSYPFANNDNAHYKNVYYKLQVDHKTVACTSTWRPVSFVSWAENFTVCGADLLLTLR